MIRSPPRSTLDRSSAASDVYKRQRLTWSSGSTGVLAAAITTSAEDGPDRRDDLVDLLLGHRREDGQRHSTPELGIRDRKRWRVRTAQLTPIGVMVQRDEVNAAPDSCLRHEFDESIALDRGLRFKPQHVQAVSYTHLTLPTSDLVLISVVAGSLKKKRREVSTAVRRLRIGVSPTPYKAICDRLPPRYHDHVLQQT